MKPMQQGCANDEDFSYFGEMDQNNRLDGKGVQISFYNAIYIGFYINGWDAPDNFIEIGMKGEFRVGEHYRKDGKVCRRATVYNTDGTAKEWDGN